MYASRMTTALQKKGERFFVEQAIRSLKADWTILAEREPPDFLIGDAGRQFGLEVIDIFIGLQTSAGSKIVLRPGFETTGCASLGGQG